VRHSQRKRGETGRPLGTQNVEARTQNSQHLEEKYGV
jgi:hypothetical protein